MCNQQVCNQQVCNKQEHNRQETKPLSIINGLIPAEFLQDGANYQAIQGELAGFDIGHIHLSAGQIDVVTTQRQDGVQPPIGTQFLDATDCIVLPGFVDIHVHGGAGDDTMDASVDALTRIAHFKASHGTTSFMPTTITAPHADIVNGIAAVAEAMKQPPGGGARLLGVHVEGPYISPAYPGAQPVAYIREPCLTELAAWLDAGPVRMITLASEQPNAREFIQEARRQGITVVLGHTNATYAACVAAIKAGASQATHTYNAMRGLHHREPGTLGAVLANDALYAQLIADRIHVHPAAMQILARCKGIERTILITDAMRAAGLPDGVYDLGRHAVTVADGACRLADGTLAGSTLTMEVALRNFMQATHLSLAEAWPATSRVPAQSIGLADHLGQIRPGYWADLVVLDNALQVVATVVAGVVVYLAERERLR